MKTPAHPLPSAILVVDSDPVLRNSMVTVLARQQYRVFEANGAAEAILLANSLEHELDLLILGDAGERANGMFVAEELRRVRTKLKILQLSAVPLEALAAQGRLIQNGEFLHKPFRLSDLVRKVKRILAITGIVIPIRTTNAGSDTN